MDQKLDYLANRSEKETWLPDYTFFYHLLPIGSSWSLPRQPWRFPLIRSIYRLLIIDKSNLQSSWRHFGRSSEETASPNVMTAGIISLPVAFNWRSVCPESRYGKLCQQNIAKSRTIEAKRGICSWSPYHRKDGLGDRCREAGSLENRTTLFLLKERCSKFMQNSHLSTTQGCQNPQSSPDPKINTTK